MHTILLVEDDLIFLKLLTTVLRTFKDKFKFISASNGQDAIEILEDKSISLLVTDIVMPKVDGFELLTYVKKHHPIMPCVVMTAHELDKTLLTDVIHLFPKPLNPQKVGEAIVKILERDIPLGTLYGISVVRFLDLIEMERRTCLCEVTLPSKERGFLYFDKGVLYDVVCGDLKKEEAAIKLITAESANFRFKYFPKKKIAKRLKMDLSRLIQEARRRQMGLTPKKIKDPH